jgi:hypothetical protein
MQSNKYLMWIRNSFSISCSLLLENLFGAGLRFRFYPPFMLTALWGGTGTAGTVTLCLGGTGTTVPVPEPNLDPEPDLDPDLDPDLA